MKLLLSQKLKNLQKQPLTLLLNLQPKKLQQKLQLRRNNDYGRHKSRTDEC